VVDTLNFARRPVVWPVAGTGRCRLL